MNTAAQLNQLLCDLDLAYGMSADLPVTLRLPEIVYTEEIVIQGRPVTLQGSENGTVLAGGLHITASNDAKITLRGLTFSGDGTGTAITSGRDTDIRNCRFEQYDLAWRALDDAKVTHRNCIFDVAEAPQ